MDRQNSGLKKIGTLLFLVWTFFSAALFGGLCIVISVFSRNLARYVGRAWNVHILKVGGIKVKVNGAEKIDKSKMYIFIANHQSALDIPVLYANLSHQVSFIAKKELFLIPFFGWGMAAVGHVWIDRSNARKAHESMIRAIRRLKKENLSLILFPEGTRSVDGKVGEFKKASFTLALKAGVQVVPLAIRNSSQLLPKNTAQIKPGIIYLDIGDPIDITEGLTKGEICSRVYDVIKNAVEQDLH